MQNIQQKQRLFEFDLLRVIAILAMIMIHVSVRLVINNNQNSTNFIIGNIFNSISVFAVPFFVMISGYFMLDENKIIQIPKIKNKILKLIFLTLFWSFFYALILHYHNITRVFICGLSPLWYLYLITGLYLMTPVLRLFVKEDNRNYIYYCVILGIIFIFIPNLLNIVLVPNLASEYFKQYGIIGGGFLVYYLIGWGFHHFQNKIKSIKIPLIIVIISLITIITCTQFIHSSYYKPYKIFYSSENIPALIYSVFLFSLIYKISNKYSENINSKIKYFISKCSYLSFGVYLVHVGFLHLFINLFKQIQDGLFYIILLYTLTTLCSFITAYILSKIKYIKQLIIL